MTLVLPLGFQLQNAGVLRKLFSVSIVPYMENWQDYGYHLILRGHLTYSTLDALVVLPLNKNMRFRIVELVVCLVDCGSFWLLPMIAIIEILIASFSSTTFFVVIKLLQVQLFTCQISYS